MRITYTPATTERAAGARMALFSAHHRVVRELPGIRHPAGRRAVWAGRRPGRVTPQQVGVSARFVARHASDTATRREAARAIAWACDTARPRFLMK